MNKLPIHEVLPDGRLRYTKFWINFITSNKNDDLEQLLINDNIIFVDYEDSNEPDLVFETERDMTLFLLRWS